MKPTQAPFSWPWLCLTLVVSGILWFGMLGYRDLVDPDEGRYAQIPAAMVDTGDWVTPRLNGFRYFEKPALQYWATATAYKMMGKSNASARLWTALSGFALAFFVAYAALQLYGIRAAIFTFLISISSMMTVIVGHLISLDMSLSFFLVAAIACLALGQQYLEQPGRAKKWMVAAWALLALATLSKGLVAIVLAAGTLLIYSLWNRDFKIWQNIHLGKGLLIFLLLTAPWFIAVELANPGFAEFFFIHEHFDRYTSSVHNRDGPLYYFIPILLVGVCPWLIASCKSLLQPNFRQRTELSGTFDVERFFWTFIVFTLVFFSLGKSKLPGYIMPIIPVLAMLTGRRLALASQTGPDKWVMLIAGVLFVGVSFAAPRFASERFPLEQWLSYSRWILAAGLFYVLAAGAQFGFRHKPVLACTLAALLCLASAQSLVLGFQSMSETRSGRSVANAIMESVPADAPVFSYRNHTESVPFYLGKLIKLVEYQGEMAMGIKMQPEDQIASFDLFLTEWEKYDQAALIINKSSFNDEILHKLNGKVIYSSPKRMVIIKS